MKVMRDRSELQQVPAVYAMYGGRGRYTAYVGVGQKLKNRAIQHLVRRDSSVTTGTSAVQLNPDHSTELAWWEHPNFIQRHIPEAAEMVAVVVLDPCPGRVYVSVRIPMAQEG